MFNETLQHTFEIFTWMHFAPVLIIFTICALIIKYQQKLREKRYFNFLRYGLAVLILLQEVSLQIYRLSMGIWDVSISLPLQLCSVGVIMTAILLITKNEKLFQRFIFILFIGASLALITPGITSGYGFPHYRYFQFFVSHGLIVINLTVLLFVFEYQKNIVYKHLLYNFITLLGLVIVVLIVNVLTGGNYMYIMEKPAPGTLFDQLAPHPYYILQIFFFGIPIFFHLFYLPFFIRNKRFKRNHIQVS